MYFRIDDRSADEISLYDASGKLSKKQNINKNNNVVNTHDLTDGTYLYKITAAGNKIISSGKIIVK